MKDALTGQVVIVFGATGRVGPGVCKVLAGQGAHVVVHYNSNAAKAQSLVSELSAQGASAFAVQADVTDLQSVSDCIRAVADKFGRIDAVINQVHRDKEFQPVVAADMLWEHWEPHIEAMQVHFHICKAVIPYMRGQHYGRIVYISGGLSFRFFSGCSAFSAAKAGMNAFCKTLALEEGHNGINVNIVAPGKITGEEKTDGPGAWKELEDEQMKKNPLGRFATPEDIGNAAMSFLLPGASYITGQTLFLAGGEIMPMP